MDTPNFAAWGTDVLTQFALEAYTEMQRNRDTIEQLRLDNKDLSKINRELLTKEIVMQIETVSNVTEQATGGHSFTIVNSEFAFKILSNGLYSRKI
jgi:hypothetical protein